MTTSILVMGGTGTLRRPVAQRLRDAGATPVAGARGSVGGGYRGLALQGSRDGAGDFGAPGEQEGDQDGG
jgi:hypothetical protein